MPGPVFRQGKTIALCPIEEEDDEFLEQLINDPRVRREIDSFDPINRAQERDWIDSLGEDGVHFLICVEGEAVGTIGLNPLYEIAGVSEVGYMITPEQWGLGYATDALTTICGYAFEERRLNKVSAHAYETNPASCRVLQNAGFTEEGCLREGGFVDGAHVDVRCYGLLNEEWFEDRDQSSTP